MRYLTTLTRFWSTALAAEMEYRANFVLTAIHSTLALSGALLVLWALFRTGYEPGGWSWPAAMLVVAAYTILDGFQATFLTPNRQRVTEMVQDGSLDFVLLKPLDTQFWLSTRHLRIWGLPNLLLGIVLAVFAGSRIGPAALGPEAGPTAYPLSPVLATLGFTLALLLGLTILYALGFILSTLTIWFVKMHNITTAMQALLEAGRYPVAAYPPAYRAFFTFVLPVAFMTTTPATFVTGHAGPATLAAAALIATALLLFSRWFWRFALRSYTSASS
ncbi:MAG: ABC-2 family transporter protein [Planctomycetota bacterium]